MSMTFNTIVSTDLRTSGGHSLKIVEVTGVEGSYPSGGIVVDPADFGFSEIHYMSSQDKVIGPTDINDAETWGETWTPVADINPVRTDINLDGNYEWRIIILLHPGGYGGAQGDGLMEIPDGTPMVFYPQNRPVMMIVGS